MSVLKIVWFAMGSCRSDVSAENSKVCMGSCRSDVCVENSKVCHGIMSPSCLC